MRSGTFAGFVLTLVTLHSYALDTSSQTCDKSKNWLFFTADFLVAANPYACFSSSYDQLEAEPVRTELFPEFKNIEDFQNLTNKNRCNCFSRALGKSSDLVKANQLTPEEIKEEKNKEIARAINNLALETAQNVIGAYEFSPQTMMIKAEGESQTVSEICSIDRVFNEMKDQGCAPDEGMVNALNIVSEANSDPNASKDQKLKDAFQRMYLDLFSKDNSLVRRVEGQCFSNNEFYSQSWVAAESVLAKATSAMQKDGFNEMVFKIVIEEQSLLAEFLKPNDLAMLIEELKNNPNSLEETALRYFRGNKSKNCSFNAEVDGNKTMAKSISNLCKRNQKLMTKYLCDVKKPLFDENKTFKSIDKMSDSSASKVLASQAMYCEEYEEFKKNNFQTFNSFEQGSGFARSDTEKPHNFRKIIAGTDQKKLNELTKTCEPLGINGNLTKNSCEGNGNCLNFVRNQGYTTAALKELKTENQKCDKKLGSAKDLKAASIATILGGTLVYDQAGNSEIQIQTNSKLNKDLLEGMGVKVITPVASEPAQINIAGSIPIATTKSAISSSSAPAKIDVSNNAQIAAIQNQLRGTDSAGFQQGLVANDGRYGNYFNVNGNSVNGNPIDPELSSELNRLKEQLGRMQNYNDSEANQMVQREIINRMKSVFDNKPNNEAALAEIKRMQSQVDAYLEGGATPSIRTPEIENNYYQNSSYRAPTASISAPAAREKTEQTEIADTGAQTTTSSGGGSSTASAALSTTASAQSAKFPPKIVGMKANLLDLTSMDISGVTSEQLVNKLSALDGMDIGEQIDVALKNEKGEDLLFTFENSFGAAKVKKVVIRKAQGWVEVASNDDRYRSLINNFERNFSAAIGQYQKEYNTGMTKELDRTLDALISNMQKTKTM